MKKKTGTTTVSKLYTASLWQENVSCDLRTELQYVVLSPDEKDVNEYFFFYKRSSELKFVL